MTISTLFKGLLFTLLYSGVISVRIIEQNHHEVTVKVGDEVKLVCTAETIVKACNFRDPKGETYPIFDGAKYAGRITKTGLTERDCGIMISDLRDEDHGVWECSISAVNEDNEFSLGKGSINVTVAIAPTAVSLRVDDEPLTSSILKVKLDETSVKKVQCIAEAARPRPTFRWYIGSSEFTADIESSEVNPTSEGKADYIETLSYFADPSHNGQKLRCVLDHMGYTPAQIEQQENIADIELELLFKPQQSPKDLQEFYELVEGESQPIRMTFTANPKPTDGEWNINGAVVAVGSQSLDQKYTSSFIEEGDLPGQYLVTLTINSLSKEDVGKENTLRITNDEGSTDYKFILGIGSKPPTDDFAGMPIHRQGASASGPIIGIVILVLILIFLIGFGIFARVKGILCFAAKRKGDDTEQAVEKEGDTESAEDNAANGVDKEVHNTTNEETPVPEDTTDHKEEPVKKGPTVASRFSNLFAVVKKSVASKGSNTKEKYATADGDAEAKLNEEEKKDAERDDITYADIDTTALGPGTRGGDSVRVESEKTEYAVIKTP